MMKMYQPENLMTATQVLFSAIRIKLTVSSYTYNQYNIVYIAS